MKVNVLMFGDSNKQINDNELLVAKDFVLQDITLWMRWCGIDSVAITRPRPMLAISEMEWHGLDIVPKFIKELRAYVLTYIIKMLMDVCNISNVNIDLTPEEKKERADYWDTFNSVKVAIDPPSKPNG